MLGCRPASQVLTPACYVENAAVACLCDKFDVVGNAAQWREAKLSRAPACVALKALEAGRRQIKDPTWAAKHTTKRYAVRASHDGRWPLVHRDVVYVQQHFPLPQARVWPRIRR